MKLFQQIKKLLKKSVIVYSTPDESEFISGIFTMNKKGDNKRMILNLKKFNTFVYYKHFKTESIDNVINLMKPNVFMASIKLKDAFSQYLSTMIIKNILSAYLEICFNLHPCLMAMDLL